MKKGVFLVLLFLSCMTVMTASAQKIAGETQKVEFKEKKHKKHKKPKKKRPFTARRFFIGTDVDGAMFSTAFIHHVYPPLTTQLPTNTVGTVRFSGFLNTGITFNFNITQTVGVFTGIDIKNIGFNDFTYADSTIKRRSYNVGIPLGIKIGNMDDKKPFGFIGGGIDKPINYKQKQYFVRNEKTERFSEWFSKRTPEFMPYVFIGAALKQGAVFKLQYYPGNFLNPNYAPSKGYNSNYGYDVHVLLLSIGYWVPIRKRHDIPGTTVTANGQRQVK